MKNFRHKFIASATSMWFVNAMQSVLMLAVGIILARSVVPQAFGEFAYMLAIVEGLSLMIGFGINTSILQDTEHSAIGFPNTGFFLATLLVGGYSLVSAAVGWLFVPETLSAYLLIMSGKSVFMLSGVHGLLLQKDFKFGIFSIVQFVSFLVSSAIAVVLALRGYELSALVAQYVILQALIAVLTVAYSPFTVRPSYFLHKEHAITFWRNGKELFVSQMVEKLVATLDKIVITRYLGAISLAFYNRAIGSSQRFQSILVGVLQPLFSVSFAGLKEDREKTRQFFHTAVWVVLRASLLITLIIVSAPREFILILFGSNWLFAAGLIPLVSVFVLLSPVRTLCRNFLLSNGQFRSVRNIQLLELGMFVMALAVGVYSGGIAGFAVSVSVWMLLGVSLYFLIIGRMMAMESKRLFVLPGILFVLVMSLSAALRDNPWILGLDIYSAGLVRSAPAVAIVGVALFAFESADLRALVRRVRG